MWSQGDENTGSTLVIISCNACKQIISCNRFKCCTCTKYNLCNMCYDGDEHDTTHPFKYFASPTTPGVRLRSRGSNGKRKAQTFKGKLRGILPGRKENLERDNKDGSEDIEHPGIRCNACHEDISNMRYRCSVCLDYQLCYICYDDGEHERTHPFKLFDSTTLVGIDLPLRKKGVSCDACDVDIYGKRYKCCVCYRYDLCHQCYVNDKHDSAHPFKIFDPTTTLWLYLPPRKNDVRCDGCDTVTSGTRYKCRICFNYNLCGDCYFTGKHDVTHPFTPIDSTASPGPDLTSRKNDLNNPSIFCNVCRLNISDMRYKCSVCSNYQLCNVCYENGEHDLSHRFKLFDSTTSPGLDLPSRDNAIKLSRTCCNVCHQDISDMRYKCTVCSDYHLCYICYEKGEHDTTHRFKLFDSTESSGLDLPLRQNHEKTNEIGKTSHESSLNFKRHLDHLYETIKFDLPQRQNHEKPNEIGKSSHENSLNYKHQLDHLYEAINNEPITECRVCSELSEENVRLEPCNHKPACEDCSSKMKKCLQCGVVIQKRVTKHGKIILARAKDVSVEKLRLLECKIVEIEKSQACNICTGSKRNILFLCGHGACSKCADTLERCHMCWEIIRMKIPIL